MITARAFEGLHFAVLGLARSGLATIDALLASGAEVTAWDDSADARGCAPAGAKIEDFVNTDLSGFDSIVVTPGLPLNRHPIAQRARDAGVEIIGDIELFARARPELPRHLVVGITGTNGKSTTTALLHHILETAGIPSLMGGNIGLPILGRDPLPEGGVYVLELSSYQIDLTMTLDCEIAILLNITPDHLDRYDDFEAYAGSKQHLFEMQSPGHSAIIVVEDPATETIALQLGEPGSHGPELIAVTSDRVDDLGSEQQHWPSLQGPHNLQNVAAALAACDRLGIERSTVADALRSYRGLPHRMERICEKRGLLFVNDSKATNPTATAPALAAFPRIRWICGGQAKSDRLDECAPFFDHVAKAYTIGEAGERFAKMLGEAMPATYCVTLEAAVRAAVADANKGETVLLSPACASFDQFRDYEQRGEQFRRLVEEL